MKLCSPSCAPLCDFCIHYAFNGVTVSGDLNVYMGDGFCRIDGAQRDPADFCRNFVCGSYVQGETWEGRRTND